MNSPTKEASSATFSPPAEGPPTQVAFIEKAELQLKDWGTRLEQLGKEAEKMTADAKATAFKKIGELKTKVGGAREKLHASKSVAGDKWNETKMGLETVWSDVKALFEKHDPKRVS